jgi:hypothetical protein
MNSCCKTRSVRFTFAADSAAGSAVHPPQLNPRCQHLVGQGHSLKWGDSSEVAAYRLKVQPLLKPKGQYLPKFTTTMAFLYIKTDLGSGHEGIRSL